MCLSVGEGRVTGAAARRTEGYFPWKRGEEVREWSRLLWDREERGGVEDGAATDARRSCRLLSHVASYLGMHVKTMAPRG